LWWKPKVACRSKYRVLGTNYCLRNDLIRLQRSDQKHNNSHSFYVLLLLRAHSLLPDRQAAAQLGPRGGLLFNRYPLEWSA